MAYATLRGAKIQNIIIISTCGMKIIYEKKQNSMYFSIIYALIQKNYKVID